MIRTLGDLPSFATATHNNAYMDSVPVATLCRFLEAVSVHPHSDRSQIASYAGRSERTALRTLPALQALGLVEVDTTNRYVATSPGPRTGSPEEEYRQVVRRALLRYRPFEVLAAGLAVGEPEVDARRKASVILGGDPGWDVLIGWAVDLNLLERTPKGGLRLAEEVTPSDYEQLLVLTPEDVSSEARARLYIASRLSQKAAAFIDEVIWSGLSAALLSIRDDPSDAVQAAGNALEDFLRELSADRGLQAKAAKCNGAGQLANMLHTEGVIHTNHMHMVMGHGAARNTQGHSKDKKTHVPWEVDSHSAFWAVTGALLLIRSIHTYVYEGRQVL